MKGIIVLTWLQENIQRLFVKSPTFFKVWIWISGALVLITGVPEFITAMPFNITIPDLWNAKITLIVAWASRGVLLMSLLTTQSKPAAITTTGAVLKVTDNKLPFTAVTEQIAAGRQGVPIVEINK